jgi:ribosomal protein L4
MRRRRSACSISSAHTVLCSSLTSCLRPPARSYLSARNIPFLNLRTLDNLNARDILRAKKLVVSKGAMTVLTERYGADEE